MRIATVLSLLASLALADAAAPAQDGPAPPPRPRKEGGPVFVPPEEGAPRGPVKKEPEKPPEPPKTEIQKLLETAASWPSAEARAAADRMVQIWPEAKPALTAALRTRPVDGRVVAAAAYAFRRATDPEGLDPLLAALADPRVFPWAQEILESLVALDPLGARERLFPLLSVPSAAVVDRAAKVLLPLLGPQDVPRLLVLASSRLPATRRAALGMASEVDFPASREALVAGLGDLSPEVALACAVALGYRSEAPGVAMLNEAARGADARRGAYAVIALSLAAERLGGAVTEDATLASLAGSRGLRSTDPLLRTVAAIALADVGHQRADSLVDPILEKEVVPALLEVVAGARFFPDIMALKPLVLARLWRLCPGTERLQTAPDWSGWWDANAGSFQARRALTGLPPAARRTMRVVVEGEAAAPAGPGVYGAEAAAAPPAGGAGGRFVALSPEEADGVAGAVEASGMLAMPETVLLGDVKPVLEVTVDTGNRARTVRFAPGAAIPPGIRALLDALGEVRAANRWQCFWDRRVAPTFAGFVEAERPFWLSKDPQPAERDRRLVRLAVGALAGLEEADRVKALEALRTAPALAEAVRQEDAVVLASFAAVGPRLSPSGEAALRVLAAAGRVEGLSPLRARLDAATDDAERAVCGALLEEAFRAAPAGAVMDAAGEASSPAVRGAALRALGSRGGDAGVPGVVRAASSAGDPAVRGDAYRALGRLRTEDALAVLSVAAEREADIEAKAGALEGLGALGGREVIPLLGRASQSADARVRAAAVRGLGATREPEALAFVLSLLTSDGDTAVREEADRAVRAAGGDRAREALRAVALDRRQPAETRARAVEGLGVLGVAESGDDLRALLADEQAEVADAAAFVLAWVRDGEAAPRLLDALRAGRSPARTIRSLELLSLESFRQVRDREEALALYTGWFGVSKDRGPRGWLAEALSTRGYADETIREFETGANPRAGVPSLLKALRDRSWFLRRAANLELRRIAGKDFGDIDPWTAEDKAGAVAAAWNEWWERERGGAR